ncbi:C-type lectin domain family 4 member E-like isoform X2 [Stigmatopora nigra]
MDMQKIHTKNIPNKEENADEVNGENNPCLLTEGPYEEAAGPSYYSGLAKPPEDIYASISETEKKAQCKMSLRILCIILSVSCLAMLVAIVVVATREYDRYQQITSPSQDKNQYGWVRLYLSCYYLSTFTLNSFQSTEHCERKGSSLVSIHTDDVQNFLTENGKGWTYWLRLRTRGDERPPGYWSPKQSNGYCVFLNSSEPADSNWFMAECLNNQYFICEK